MITILLYPGGNVVEIKIGNTPLVELKKLKKELGLKANIFAKLEGFNPAGSVKDRIALYMIKDAEEQGLLNKDTLIIEPTSGNTGIGIAYIAKLKGYKCVLTMPESMSIERRNMLKSYGAELELTPASLGMKGAIAKANEMHEQNPNSIILGQFDNPSNPKAHYETTGPEIYKQLNGRVDFLVAGVGTGGTISGTGKYIKEQNKDIKVVAVEPLGSPVLSEGHAGAHKIQGIGAGFIPKTLNTSIYDEIMPISDENAFKYGKLAIRVEELSIGISSGAALCAAIELASREENKDKNIVVICPDKGDRYLSTDLYK